LKASNPHTVISADAASIMALIRGVTKEQAVRALLSSASERSVFEELGFALSDGTSPSSYCVVLHGGIRIGLQDRPTPFQPGNFLLLSSPGAQRGESYGVILSTLDKLCGGDVLLEAKLAQHMLHFAQNCHMPSREQMRNDGFHQVDSNHTALARFFLLVTIKEISRRFPPSLGHQAAAAAASVSQATAVSAPEAQELDCDRFPFAQALVRALLLICAGKKRLSEVFAPDAPFGLATGTSITSSADGIDKAHAKLGRINQVYHEVFVATSEAMRQTIEQDPLAYIQTNIERARVELDKAYPPQVAAAPASVAAAAAAARPH
jgi:hypothetical protein